MFVVVTVPIAKSRPVFQLKVLPSVAAFVFLSLVLQGAPWSTSLQDLFFWSFCSCSVLEGAVEEEEEEEEEEEADEEVEEEADSNLDLRRTG